MSGFINRCSGPLLAALVFMAVIAMGPSANAQIWGRLANPGFENQRIKATLFFAGQARDGTIKYGDCDPGNDFYSYIVEEDREKYRACLVDADHRDLYVVHPSDSAHLRWSEGPAYREVALNMMVGAGINVINMSSWGEDFLPCAWVTGAAPMQLDPEAQNQLFTAAIGKPLLIVPFLESRGTNARYPWEFRGEFPRRPDGSIAPGAVSQITNMIHRYLKNPTVPAWASKWARFYDRHGEDRYGVVIIHAASDRLGANDHAAFAAGFDEIANEVFRITGGEENGGVKVGFFIDALPPASNAPGVFKPSPEATGSHLTNTISLLGIECFAPEVWFGSADTTVVINWKRDFSRRWFQTGVPFVMDVSPGYDAHCFFSPVFRYGLTNEWTDQLAQMNRDYGRAGMVFNAWNGYAESLVAVPTREYGSLFYDWLRSSLQYADVYARTPAAPVPRNGTWSSPYTLAEAIANVPVGGTIGLLPTTSGPFSAPGRIEKACTLISIGGSATIGQ